MPLFTRGLGFFCLLACASVWAQPQSLNTQKPIGENTRNWLEVQRSGQQASQQQQTLSGPVAAKIYQRYENSFTHPIPEYFIQPDSDVTR